MNAPTRPDVRFDPDLADFCAEPASNIRQALDDLYEAAFGNGDRNHKMDQAHAAPSILQHAIHELFYLRAENLRLSAQIGDIRLWPNDPSDQVELSDAGEQIIRAAGNGRFPALVADELARAKREFPPLASAHEAYAVIAEELDEFWERVRLKRRWADALLKELVQVAAMCQRAAEDLRLSGSAEPEPRSPNPKGPGAEAT